MLKQKVVKLNFNDGSQLFKENFSFNDGSQLFKENKAYFFM